MHTVLGCCPEHDVFSESTKSLRHSHNSVVAKNAKKVKHLTSSRVHENISFLHKL